MANRVFGVDISYYQPGFDFTKAKAEGVRFAILKCGGADGQNGTLYKDMEFERHYAEAKRCGVPVGVYYFGMAKNADDGKREFEHCFGILEGKVFEYPIYYDIEAESLRELGIKDFTPGIDTFLGNFKKAGYLSGIYTNQAWYNLMDGDYITHEYEFWLATWTSSDTIPSKYSYAGLWQFSSESTYVGTNLVAGQVCDKDWAYKDYPKIIRSNGLNKYDENFTYYTTSYDSAIAGTSISPLDILNTDNITPYITTVNRNTKSLNVRELKDFGVVGIVIEAGRLFDDIHLRMEYRNPKLTQQLKVVEGAKIPYGLYADVCARNLNEAREELYELKFIVRAYPPNIGVWLRLHLTSSLTVNDSIIKLYKESLESWGFSGRIGIYATKSQIQKISWKSKWSKDMFLWLDDHLNSVDSLDELLTPSLFSV